MQATVAVFISGSVGSSDGDSVPFFVASDQHQWSSARSAQWLQCLLEICWAGCQNWLCSEVWCHRAGRSSFLGWLSCACFWRSLRCVCLVQVAEGLVPWYTLNIWRLRLKLSRVFCSFSGPHVGFHETSTNSFLRDLKVRFFFSFSWHMLGRLSLIVGDQVSHPQLVVVTNYVTSS